MSALWKSKNSTNTQTNSMSNNTIPVQTACITGNATWIGGNTGGLTPGSIIPMTNVQQLHTWAASGLMPPQPPPIQTSWGTSYSAYPTLPVWPWDALSLTKEEIELVVDYKTRHPDFDTYMEEIQLILSRKPGLKNTPLFISLIYEMAQAIRKQIDNYVSDCKVEEVLDGKTQEGNGTG